MARTQSPLPDPDDMFADTRMTFGEHLEDLRQHLWRAIWSFVIAVFISFFIAHYVLWIIQAPVENALLEYHWRYYQKNPDREMRILEQIKGDLQKHPNAPYLKPFVEPVALEAGLSREALQRALREMYPHLFKQEASPGGRAEVSANNANVGDPQANSADGNADTIPATITVRPIDFLEKFRIPLGIVSKRVTLISMNPMEVFMVWFKVAIITGLVLASPWIFYHIWSFIAAGLYPHEKRLVYNSLFPSVGLFLIGVVVCQILVIPAALRALLEFNLWLNIEPDFRLSEWLSFAILMPVITGLCFQLPLVMYVLGRIGIITPEQMASKRRIAWFVMLILVALVTPSVDPASLLIIWLPMVLLYEVGLWAVKAASRRPPQEEEEVPYEPGETWWDWEESPQADGRR
jgi:sec-independent protein translocase protein TatC